MKCDPPCDKVRQITDWLLSGASDVDVLEAMKKSWPEADHDALISKVIERLAQSGHTDPEVLRGWCFEAFRELYRRMVEIGDYPGPSGPSRN